MEIYNSNVTPRTKAAASSSKKTFDEWNKRIKTKIPQNSPKPAPNLLLFEECFSDSKNQQESSSQHSHTNVVSCL